MKRTDQKSHCPVNFALEAVGDPWSLLVVRDIVFHGKHTFGEFLAAEERITTSVLADRLTTLVRTGILTKSRDPADRRRETYALTGKGLALIPVLVELANWGVSYDPEVVANQLWVSKARTDREGLYRLIRDTVLAGGSLFRGDDSVISQLRQAERGARAQPPGIVQQLQWRDAAAAARCTWRPRPYRAVMNRGPYSSHDRQLLRALGALIG